MNRRRTIRPRNISFILGLIACLFGAALAKTVLPISISAGVEGDSRAKASVTFERSAQDVIVRLSPTGSTRFEVVERSLKSVGRGERLELDATFAAPTPDGSFAVYVMGNFGAGPQVQVKSFRAAQGNPADKVRGRESQGSTEAIIRVPVETRVIPNKGSK